MRFSLRDGVVFLSGFEFFHTLLHGVLYYMDSMIETPYFLMTPTVNLWSMFATAAITTLLLGWSCLLKKPLIYQLGDALMPYKKIADLPDTIKSVLPVHAQEIYQKAFNSAWEEYKNPKKRHDPEETQEEVCYKVAWAAVKKVYKKDDKGHWVKV